MLTPDFFINLLYALGVGLLIGLERSFGPLGIGNEEPQKKKSFLKKDKKDESADMLEFMGVRTFSILSLTGFAFGMAGEKFEYLAPAALVTIVVLVAVMYLQTTKHGFGITTEISAIAAFALGILCHFHPQAAGIIALSLTIILSAKRITYKTITKMRRVELTDTLKFLVIIIIVLPLLPNQALDPFNAFNPYKVGFLVILISGISFFGYFLTRILGAQKGLGITGVLGGLTSSTAVTAAMSDEAKNNPSLNSVCAFSTLIANSTMFVRVLFVVMLLDMQLFFQLIYSLGGMAVTAIAVSGILWFSAAKNTQKEQDEAASHVKLKNPFSLGPALKFGAFFVLILFIVRLAQDYLGDSGLFAAAALSGLADVDAITLSISEQTKAGELIRGVGSIGITIAVVSNSVVKTGIAFYSGGIKFGRTVASGLGAATVVGLTLAFVTG